MSLTAHMWSSSPISLGRPSSPLNPHSNAIAGPSSSPLTSPTPLPSSPSPFSLGPTHSHPPSYRPRSTSYPASQSRHARPNNKRSPTSYISPQMVLSTTDPFESKGVTPVESAMWKEKFARRVKDRERRKKAREVDLDRRRSIEQSDEIMDEEEADRQAQADDEEIFRRMVVMQRKKAEHQHLVNYEVETGGSDPALPEFWEEEEFEQEMDRHFRSQTPTPGSMNHNFAEDDDPMVTPKKPTWGARCNPILADHDEEEEWERQAIEAEQAERDAEEAEVAQRIEQAYGFTVPRASNEELDMDWDAFDAMDIE